MTLRLAILPPAPAAYREPLFEALAARPEVELRVIYQSAAPRDWNAAPGFSPADHVYPSVVLRARQRTRPGRSPIVIPAGVEAALRDADPACVIGVEYGAASLRALAWARTHRRAFAIFSDCTPAINRLLSPPQLRLHRVLARHADAMIAVSSAGRRRLEQFGVPSQRIFVAPQGGDLEPVRAAAAARSAEAGRPAGGVRPEGVGAVGAGGSGGPSPLSVLSAGRLVPDKNFGALIEAVTRCGPGVELQIVGTGFEEDSLRALATARGGAVRFLGAVAPASMAALYARADAFALVSTFEPFGVVVAEAVAAGLPIICSRVAGAAGDVAIQGHNALLVDPHDVDAITGALRKLRDDPALRATLAAGSRAIDAEREGADVEAIVTAARAAVARRARIGTD